MMCHVFLSNIFLLNYLIAILSTVYHYMVTKGDFNYKRSKYQFIEKYSIPLQEKWGYQELVVHPAPLNAFTVFLIPFTIRKQMMRSMANLFSKIVFWLENMVYIVLYAVYELVLVPFIFLKVVGNVFRVAGFFSLLPLLIIWCLYGPFVLIIGVFKDFYFFIKTLCNYQV